VHARIRGGSSWRWPQIRVGLPTTAIFGDLSGYTSSESDVVRNGVIRGHLRKRSNSSLFCQITLEN